MVLKATGKAIVYHTVAMTVRSENPNHMRNRGSQAMPDRDWKNRRGGMRREEAYSLSPRTNPRTTPTATPVPADSLSSVGGQDPLVDELEGGPAHGPGRGEGVLGPPAQGHGHGPQGGEGGEGSRDPPRRDGRPHPGGRRLLGRTPYPPGCDGHL